MFLGTWNRMRNAGRLAALGLACLLAPANTNALEYQEVYRFPGAAANPAGGLVEGSDGNFYGATFGGGDSGVGAFYKVTPDGIITTLASFNGTNGAYPRGSLVTDGAGNFYGITYAGGIRDSGTVFKAASTGTITVLHDFQNDEGTHPYGGLLLASDGYLYGTTESFGTIYKVSTSGAFSVVTKSFGLRGESLNCTLIQGTDGALYGTAGFLDYSKRGGIVFKVLTNGFSEIPLVTFGAADGDKPIGGLVQAPDGTLYGTASAGGTYDRGTVFSVSNNVVAVVYDFDAIFGTAPYAPPILTMSGQLVGSVVAGGPSNEGALFILTSGAPYPLQVKLFAGTDGSQPFGKLLQASDGNIYGTTRFGGAAGLGTVFRIAPDMTFTTLASFAAPQGLQPHSTLLETNGAFYGSTLGGGNGSGTIFQLGSNGVPSTLATFTNDTGSLSESPLATTGDGIFYGTAWSGGDQNLGSVFQFSEEAGLTTLFSFAGTNGANPYSGVLPASDGRLYGTTVNGGDTGNGTVFSLGTNGDVITLASFGGTNGAHPYAGLIQGADGGFYGTTYSGGASDLGTVFRIETNGAFATLVSFDGVHGAHPRAGLVQGGDGALYGVTTEGGTYGVTPFSTGYGTMFKLTTNGVFTALVNFDGTNGSYPSGGLILGADGFLYGTTSGGGDGNVSVSTIFRVASDGDLTTLFTIPIYGDTPYLSLTQAGDGSIYGTASAGAQAGGSIFRLFDPPPVLQLRFSNGQLQLAWPASASAYVLESTTNFLDPNSWTAVATPPATNGDQLGVNDDTAAPARYYRLRKP